MKGYLILELHQTGTVQSVEEESSSFILSMTFMIWVRSVSQRSSPALAFAAHSLHSIVLEYYFFLYFCWKSLFFFFLVFYSVEFYTLCGWLNVFPVHEHGKNVFSQDLIIYIYTFSEFVWAHYLVNENSQSAKLYPDSDRSWYSTRTMMNLEM